MKLLEFNEHFRSEEDCEAYLRKERESKGLVCPVCGGIKHRWDKYNKRWLCCGCHHVTTLRSGTVMHGSNLPLMYWFTAMHLLTSTKKTFSVSEIQRQLGHKRYQPIWEMVHKIRSIMGKRDGEYRLSDTIELDEGYFSSESDNQEGEPQKRGVGSQKKTKVLVMVESEPVETPKRGKKSRKCGHIKMKVISDLKSSTFESEAASSVDSNAKVIMDNLPAHAGVEKVVASSERQTVPGKDAPKILPWVHTTISNAKSLLTDMYHGVKEEFLQLYLDEFCYKFNRKYFGDRTFDRLLVAAITYRPSFEHRIYR